MLECRFEKIGVDEVSVGFNGEVGKIRGVSGRGISGF